MSALVLKGARLIDGTGAPPVDGGVVLVEGGRIEAVGAEGRVQTPEGAKVVDLPGCTIMPGLMDVHIHIAMFDIADFPTVDKEKAARLEYTPEARLLYATKRMRWQLEAGFTTIRDACAAPTAVTAALRDAVEAGTILGPRVVVGGLTIATNSHLYNLATFLNKEYPHRVSANGPWALRELAREHFLAGADYLKTDASGGVGTEHEPINRRSLTMDELEAIVDEAHALEKRVACHCHTAESIKMAVRAGVDTIEHCAYTDEEAIDLLVSHKKILVPTLTHRRTEGIEAHIRAGSHPSIIEKMKRVQEIYYNSFRKLYAAGVTMACGTDLTYEPSAGMSGLELGIYVMLGMKPMEAIQTATINTARAIGRENDLGTLEPGKLADIIAVEGNPLENIRVLEGPTNVKLVVQSGRVTVDKTA